MFLPLSAYDPDNQPLGHFKTYPIYLATVLVAVQVLSMLAGVVLSPQAYGEALQFAPTVYSPFAQPWRWLSATRLTAQNGCTQRFREKCPMRFCE